MHQLSQTLTSYRFWRPSLFALGIAALLAIICRTLVQLPGESITHRELLQLELPRPELSAREVVEIQMRGLSDHEQPGLGALQCYCFAAPANRLVTGPFRRFATMVHRPPYDRLGNSLQYLVGVEQPMETESKVRVLVTTVGEDLQIQVFAFVVGREQSGPFENCWMTLGVFPLLSPKGGEPLARDPPQELAGCGRSVRVEGGEWARKISPQPLIGSGSLCPCAGMLAAVSWGPRFSQSTSR